MNLKTALLTLASLALIGCSQYERTADAPVTPEELDSLMSEILPEVSSFDTDGTLDYLAVESYATVYVGKGTVDFDGVLNDQNFVESFDDEAQFEPQPSQQYQGFPENVFSFYDFDFIFPGYPVKNPEEKMYAEDMYDSTVLFFAEEDEGEFALVLKVWFTSEAEEEYTGIPSITKYYRQIEDAVITTDKITRTKKLEITLEDTETGELVYLQTFDVANNDRLKSVIQLEVYTEHAGELYYSGKFSTLVGYQ